MRKKNICTALEDRDYVILLAIGHGQRPDGTFTIKVAAHPVIRTLPRATWQATRETIIGAIDKLMASPLDDLEIER